MRRITVVAEIPEPVNGLRHHDTPNPAEVSPIPSATPQLTIKHDSKSWIVLAFSREMFSTNEKAKVRPNGADHQWGKDPPKELSV
jgi:hypothetical protein